MSPCIAEAKKFVRPGDATDFNQEICCGHELASDEALTLCLSGFDQPLCQVETWPSHRHIAALGLVSRCADWLMASPDNTGPIAGDISSASGDVSKHGSQMFRHPSLVVLSHRSAVVRSWLNAMLSQVSQSDIPCAISGARPEMDEHNAREPQSPKRNILLAMREIDKVFVTGCAAVEEIRTTCMFAWVKTNGLQSGDLTTQKFENGLFECADEAPAKTTIETRGEGLEGILLQPHEGHRSSIPKRRVASRRTWMSDDAGFHLGSDCRTNECGSRPAQPPPHKGNWAFVCVLPYMVNGSMRMYAHVCAWRL